MCMMRGGGSAFSAGMRRGRGEGWGEAVFPFFQEYFISYIFMLSSFTPIILFFRWFQFLRPDFKCFIYIHWFTCFLHHISHLITYISRCSDVVLLFCRTKPIPWVDLVDQWITSKTADGCFNDHGRWIIAWDDEGCGGAPLLQSVN